MCDLLCIVTSTAHLLTHHLRKQSDAPSLLRSCLSVGLDWYTRLPLFSVSTAPPCPQSGALRSTHPHSHSHSLFGSPPWTFFLGCGLRDTPSNRFTWHGLLACTTAGVVWANHTNRLIARAGNAGCVNSMTGSPIQVHATCFLEDPAVTFPASSCVSVLHFAHFQLTPVFLFFLCRFVVGCWLLFGRFVRLPILQDHAGDAANTEWLANHTKPCPKCSVPIERDAGCNHFVCNKCRHEFCWVCMGPWSEHGAETGGFYRCNRTDAIRLVSV